jgi:hypothetical protein
MMEHSMYAFTFKSNLLRDTHTRAISQKLSNYLSPLLFGCSKSFNSPFVRPLSPTAFTFLFVSAQDPSTRKAAVGAAATSVLVAKLSHSSTVEEVWLNSNVELLFLVAKLSHYPIFKARMTRHVPSRGFIAMMPSRRGYKNDHTRNTKMV